MGTEIFPIFTTIAKLLILAVALFSLITILFATIEYRKEKGNKKAQEEMKEHIVNGLIAISISLVVYLMVIAIAPGFNILF